MSFGAKKRSETIIIHGLYLASVLFSFLLIAVLLLETIRLYPHPKWMANTKITLLVLNLFNPFLLYYAIRLEKGGRLVRSTLILLGPLTLVFLGWIGLLGMEKSGFLMNPSFIDPYLTLSFIWSLLGVVLFGVVLYRGPAIQKWMAAKFFFAIAAFVFLTSEVLFFETFYVKGFLFSPRFLSNAGELNLGERTIRLILVDKLLNKKKAGLNLAICEPLKYLPLNKVHGYLKYVCHRPPPKGFFDTLSQLLTPPPRPDYCPELSVTEESGRIMISDGENVVIID